MSGDHPETRDTIGARLAHATAQRDGLAAAIVTRQDNGRPVPAWMPATLRRYRNEIDDLLGGRT